MGAPQLQDYRDVEGRDGGARDEIFQMFFGVIEVNVFHEAA
jgi:hypothetical protein